MAYVGTTTLLFNTVFGNKRISLLKVECTSYDATGIPLTAAIAGMDNIEAVIPFAHGTLANANSPLQIVYVPASSVCLCYKAVNSEVTNGQNIHATTLVGDIMLLVVGT